MTSHGSLLFPYSNDHLEDTFQTKPCHSRAWHGLAACLVQRKNKRKRLATDAHVFSMCPRNPDINPNNYRLMTKRTLFYPCWWSKKSLFLFWWLFFHGLPRTVQWILERQAFLQNLGVSGPGRGDGGRQGHGWRWVPWVPWVPQILVLNFAAFVPENGGWVTWPVAVFATKSSGWSADFWRNRGWDGPGTPKFGGALWLQNWAPKNWASCPNSPLR